MKSNYFFFTKTKDYTEKEHQHDVVYYAKCSEEICTEDCNGENAERLSERNLDQNAPEWYI